METKQSKSRVILAEAAKTFYDIMSNDGATIQQRLDAAVGYCELLQHVGRLCDVEISG